MAYEGMQEIGKCEFCSNKAEILWIKNIPMFGCRWKLLCKNCSMMFSKIRNDARQ